MVWHFTKNGNQTINLQDTAVPYSPCFAAENTKRTGRTHRPTTNSWYIPYETVGYFGKKSEILKGEKKHPAIFPAELVRKCLKLSNAKNVLDPFAGTGTVGVVAQAENIDYTLIELDADYCEFMYKRLKKTPPKRE
jgi:DNA modification methylase